jgi:undecaprenyl diphosphate synthase
MSRETVEELFRQIDLERLPSHIAVIMDGNGRWAKRRHLPRVSGHRQGIKSVRETVETSARIGLQVLTLYAFSVENWKRPKSEVDMLMTLLREYLHKELRTLMENNIRFQVIGRWQELAEEVAHDGGRTELVDAFRRLFTQLNRNGQDLPDVTEEMISNNLYTAGVPDPDLLIRTSGELRISNFLLWQIAYAEIWVTDVLWPDFRKQHLYQAIIDYQKRERRYGGITKTVNYSTTE